MRCEARLRLQPAVPLYGTCEVVRPCAQPPRKTTLCDLACSFAAALPGVGPSTGTTLSFPAT